MTTQDVVTLHCAKGGVGGGAIGDNIGDDWQEQDGGSLKEEADEGMVPIARHVGAYYDQYSGQDGVGDDEPIYSHHLLVLPSHALREVIQCMTGAVPPRAIFHDRFDDRAHDDNLDGLHPWNLSFLLLRLHVAQDESACRSG